MNKNELTNYWLESAKMDLNTMDKLFLMKEYPWSLFIGQLVIEKVLKAIYTQNVDQNVPRIHDLSRLANLSEIELSQSVLDKLDAVSTFNMNARYPDVKMTFYKTCTEEFTTRNIAIIKELYQWLPSLIKTN